MDHLPSYFSHLPHVFLRGFLVTGLFLTPFQARLYAAEVTLLQPPVEIMRKDSSQWEPLQSHQKINEKDQVRTGRGGRVEITLQPQHLIRLDQNSSIQIPRLSTKEKQIQSQVQVHFGRLWASLFRKLEANKEAFQVLTRTATLGVKGTHFDVAVDKESQETILSVLKGTVNATSNAPESPVTPKEVAGPQEVAPPQEINYVQWSVVVNAMQKIVLVSGGKPAFSELTHDDLEEEWVQFNTQRDSEL
ncbi:FecR family protein [Deltaproteobacteria bacterium TL4]